MWTNFISTSPVQLIHSAMVAEYGRRKQNKCLHIQNLLKVMNWCQLWKTSGHKGPGSMGQCCHFQRIATLRKTYFETRLKWNHMYVWQEKCSWEMIHALLKIKYIFFLFSQSTFTDSCWPLWIPMKPQEKARMMVTFAIYPRQPLVRWHAARQAENEPREATVVRWSPSTLVFPRIDT